MNYNTCGKFSIRPGGPYIGFISIKLSVAFLFVLGDDAMLLSGYKKFLGLPFRIALTMI